MKEEGRQSIVPKMHWTDDSGWGMCSSIATVLFNETKANLRAANFISISADESTARGHLASVRAPCVFAASTQQNGIITYHKRTTQQKRQKPVA